MTQRPHAVEDWFERLVGMAPPEREGPLRDLARTEPELATEVAELLAAHDRTGSSLDRLLETATFASADPSRAGTAIGQYRIGDAIGEGGMGIVYRARDSRLERDVALKFLPHWLSRDASAKERFVSEARAVSSLDHPNICTLHEIGETRDGDLFLVMPYYEGETLSSRLTRGPIPAADAVAIARDVARGLAAAHARGVVHRDIKPGNVLVTTGGIVKILDFGIAKAGDLHLTRTGERLGTLQYMAPEQLSGDVVDARADLWSLGVVLHEMLTGRRPQVGQASTDTLATIDPALAAVVTGLLEVDPEARTASADAVVRALEAPEAGRTISARSWLSRLAAAAGMAVLLGGVWFAGRGGSEATSTDVVLPGSDSARVGVAVLPFRTVGDGMELWRDGIVDLLSFNFDGLGGLRKVDPHAVIALWNERIGQGRDAPSLEAALTVGKALGARYAVTGSAVGTGASVRLTADVHDLVSGRLRGSIVVDGASDSLFAIVDGLAVDIVRGELLPVDADHPIVSLERVTTTSIPALKAYLEGERFYRDAWWEQAVDAYERAIAIDTAFARAHLRLAFALTWLNDTRGRDEHLARARALADRLAPRDRRLAEAVTLSQLAKFVAEFPDDPEGWSRYGDAAFHQGGVHVLPVTEFRVALETAIRLLPHYGESYAHLLEDAFARRDSAATFGLLARLHGPDGPGTICLTEHPLANLVWGAPAARASALSALQSLPAETLRCGWTTLAIDSRMVELMERGDRLEMLPGPPNIDRALALWRSIHARVLRGEIDAAVSLVAHADTLPVLAPLARYFGAMLHLAGLVEAETASWYKARLEGSDDFQDHFWLGAWAVHDRDWEAVARHAAQIDSAGPLPPGADGVTPSRLADALREYAALARGDLERLAPFEAALATLPTASIRYEHPAAFLRHAVAQLLAARGRLDQAARYAGSTNHYEWIGFVPAQLLLGRWHESRGEISAARRQFALAADWWRDADAVLHPARDSARAGLARLSGR